MEVLGEGGLVALVRIVAVSSDAEAVIAALTAIGNVLMGTINHERLRDSIVGSLAREDFFQGLVGVAQERETHEQMERVLGLIAAAGMYSLPEMIRANTP